MKTLAMTLILLATTISSGQPAAPETVKRFGMRHNDPRSYEWNVVDANNRVMLGADTDIPPGVTVTTVDNKMLLAFDANTPGIYVATITLEATVKPFPDWDGPGIAVRKVILLPWAVIASGYDPFTLGPREDILLSP